MPSFTAFKPLNATGVLYGLAMTAFALVVGAGLLYAWPHDERAV